MITIQNRPTNENGLGFNRFLSMSLHVREDATQTGWRVSNKAAH